MTTDELEKAVAALPEWLRKPFVMVRVHGKSYAETAEALHLSRRCVEWRITKALERCRKFEVSHHG